MHLGRTLGPVWTVVLGYASWILVGWILLTLPFSSTGVGLMGGGVVGVLDHLFIAASAVSTTGLITVDPGTTYTWFGELVVLALIQSGGLGFMTLGSFVILSRRRPLSDTRRGALATTFTLPEDFSLPDFVRGLVVFAFVVEALGFLALYPVFRSSGVDNAAWTALFHSVSAFCTAGFSLFPDSLEGYGTSVAVIFTISLLSLAGGIGFIVWLDLYRRFRGRADSVTYTTVVILRMSAWIIAGTAVVLFLAEPVLIAQPAEHRLMGALFQAVSASTTVGFNSVPMGSLSMAVSFAVILTMVVGASPAGTGGGMKTTTLTATFAALRAGLRGSVRAVWRGRVIPEDRIMLAFATAGIYCLTLATGVFLVALLETHPFLDILFEVTSALGTVGLSRGITADLRPLSELVLVATMLLGRVGPLTFGVAVASGSPEQADNVGDLVV